MQKDSTVYAITTFRCLQKNIMDPSLGKEEREKGEKAGVMPSCEKDGGLGPFLAMPRTLLYPSISGLESSGILPSRQFNEYNCSCLLGRGKKIEGFAELLARPETEWYINILLQLKRCPIRVIPCAQ